MKLQLSLIMIAALALADDGEPTVVPAPAPEPEAEVQKPSVWNNWNGDPTNIPNDEDNADYFSRKEYFN